MLVSVMFILSIALLKVSDGSNVTVLSLAVHALISMNGLGVPPVAPVVDGVGFTVKLECSNGKHPWVHFFRHTCFNYIKLILFIPVEVCT